MTHLEVCNRTPVLLQAMVLWESMWEQWSYESMWEIWSCGSPCGSYGPVVHVGAESMWELYGHVGIHVGSSVSSFLENLEATSYRFGGSNYTSAHMRKE